MSPPAKTPSPPITPEQLRQARALLGWSSERLAVHSGTTPYGVMKYENFGRVALNRGQPRGFDAVASIRAALEAAGVEFTSGDPAGAQIRRSETP